MADEKQSKTLRGKPLDGSQKVSRNTDVYNRLQGYGNEDLLKIQFSTGNVLSKNQGVDVPLSDMTVDDVSYTGPRQGFFEQNKSMIKKVSK